VGAACGFVLPRRIETVWERGRFVEYLFAFTFYKQVQDYYRRPLISSGCFSMYRTEILRRHGGWSARTLAEDMDLTWSFHEAGVGVRFVPDAVCYPIEPYNFRLMGAQLRRWSHGFLQNFTLHWKPLLRVPYLRSAVAVALWDAIVASLAFLIVLPVLIVAMRTPWLGLAYFIDAPAILVPLLIGAIPRREIGRTLASLPSFFLLRLVNGFYFLEAVWSEWLLRRSFRIYVKGH
jgi:biofilm PGA synthesis N-glycosyltransferase PgaC